jgi:hypothetical protein
MSGVLRLSVSVKDPVERVLSGVVRLSVSVKDPVERVVFCPYSSPAFWVCVSLAAGPKVRPVVLFFSLTETGTNIGDHYNN